MKLRNAFLAGMPPTALGRLERHLTPTPLAKGQQLFDAGRSAERIVFPTMSVVTLWRLQGNDWTEATSIGCESAVGLLPALADERTNTRALVQFGGENDSAPSRPWRRDWPHGCCAFANAPP